MKKIFILIPRKNFSVSDFITKIAPRMDEYEILIPEIVCLSRMAIESPMINVEDYDFDKPFDELKKSGYDVRRYHGEMSIEKGTITMLNIVASGVFGAVYLDSSFNGKYNFININ